MNKPDTNKNDDITLRILDELSREPRVTQRTLSDKLDIALGLVNAYIKRLTKKGYIKITTIPKNRVKYILTPKGFAEKIRLTYEYIDYSLNYFKDIRERIDSVYRQMITSGVKDIIIWGDGEVAELSYISMRGLPLNLIGVVDSKKVERGFFGHNVYSLVSRGVWGEQRGAEGCEQRGEQRGRAEGCPEGCRVSRGE
jgi:DNA-binding MarR family transcriptional regulator